MNSVSTSNAIRNAKVFRWLGYLLLFLMMGCGILTLGILFHQVAPGWHTGIMASILLFIVIDRLYVHRSLRTLTPLSSEWAITIGTQWIVIVLLIRLLLSYANGMNSFLEDLSRFARGYLAEFFTFEFVATVLLALLIWYLLGEFLGLLDEIGLDQERALNEESLSIQAEAVPAHQRLVNLIFSVGIVLVVLTALTRINLGTIASNTQGLPDIQVSRFSGAEAGALFYFIFGLALLSLSRLMGLQTRWNRLRIPISSENLTRQWGVYSLLFLLILAVIVSLLPAGDSLGFFSVLGTLMGFLLGVLVFLSQLIVALILLLFSLPFLLFGTAPPFLNGVAPPPLPTLPPVEPVTLMAGSEIWAVIRSILLWGSLALILLFAFVHFSRQHGGLLAGLRTARITNWLALAWQWLYRRAEQTGGVLSRALADGWQSLVSRLEDKSLLPRPAFLSVRSLDARRKIYFFYLAMIRRGGEQGLTRKPSETPSEYAASLERALPSAGEDIESLTQAFVEARYSRHEVTPSKAEAVKETWGRIRREWQKKVEARKASNE